MPKSAFALIKFRKHILFLLFGIFIFPSLFQSVHILWHQLPVSECEHHCSHSELSGKHSQTDSGNISGKEHICPICSFEFLINDLPESLIFRPVIPVFACTYSETTIPQLYKQVFADISLRAPPIHRLQDKVC